MNSETVTGIVKDEAKWFVYRCIFLVALAAIIERMETKKS